MKARFQTAAFKSGFRSFSVGAAYRPGMIHLVGTPAAPVIVGSNPNQFEFYIQIWKWTFYLFLER